jgi:hypothetical protein
MTVEMSWTTGKLPLTTGGSGSGAGGQGQVTPSWAAVGQDRSLAGHN